MLDLVGGRDALPGACAPPHKGRGRGPLDTSSRASGDAGDNGRGRKERILRHFQTFLHLFSRHRCRNIRHAAAAVRALRGAPRKGSPRARLLPVVSVYDVYVLEGQFAAQIFTKI